jgi:hypothetical protein
MDAGGAYVFLLGWDINRGQASTAPRGESVFIKGATDQSAITRKVKVSKYMAYGQLIDDSRNNRAGNKAGQAVGAFLSVGRSLRNATRCASTCWLRVSCVYHKPIVSWTLSISMLLFLPVPLR